MSALGSLVVKLALEFAQYTAGLDKSEQATLASLKRIQGAADQFSNRVSDGMKNGLGALAAFFTAGALAGQVKAVVDDLDRIADAASGIGLTTQSLAELGYAAKLSGTDAQTLEGAMGKLNLKVSEAISGNKEAAKVFDALGIKLKNAQGQVRSTDAVLAEVADTFKDLPEGPIKSALAVELFGKTGAGLLQFLSQGSEGIQSLRNEFQALSGGPIEGAAEMAGAFNDQLDKLAVKGQAATMSFGGQLLPTLTEVARMLTDTGEDALKLGDGMDLAAAAGVGLRTLLEMVLLLGSDVAYVLHGVGNEIGGIAAQAAAVLRGDFAGAGAIRDAMVKDAEDARRKLDEFQRRVVAAPQQSTSSSAEDAAERRRNDEKRRTSKEALDASARARAALQQEDKAAKAAGESYDKFMASIRARLNLADQQLALGRDLTEAEKFEAKAKEDLAKMAAQLSGAKIAAAEKEIAVVKARIEQVQIERQIEKELMAVAQERARLRNADADSVAQWLAAQEEASATTLQGIRDRLEGLRNEEAAAALAREQNIGLAEAIERVAIARLQEKQERVYTGSDEWERLQREIKAREQLIGLLGKKETREREERGWTDFFSSIDRTAHDTFVNVFEDGAGSFKRLGQTLKASVLDVLYQMTVRRWMINIGTSIFGGGFGAAAGAATGGVNPLGLMLQGTQLYSGLTSGTGMLGTVGNWLGLGTAASTAATTGMTAGMSLANPGMAAMVNPVTTGAAASGGISGALGAIPGWGWALAGVGVLASLGKKKIRDVGIEGDFGGDTGFEGQRYTYSKKWFKTKTEYTDLEEDVRAAFGDAFLAARENLREYGQILSLPVDSIDSFASHIKLSLKDLSDAEAQEAISEAIRTSSNDLAQQLIGTWETATEQVTDTIMTAGWSDAMDAAWESVNRTVTTSTYVASEYAHKGEEAIDTLARLATSMQTVNSASDALGYGFHQASLAAANAASNIIDAFGGVEAFTQTIGAYLQNFYTDAEQKSAAARSAARALGGVGIDVEVSYLEGLTRPAMRAFVESVAQQFGFESEQYVAAMQQVNLLAGFTEALPSVLNATSAIDSAAQSADQSAKDAAKAWEDINKALASDRLDAGIALLRAMGQEEAALKQERERAIEGYDAQQIAMYDGTQAILAQVAELEKLNALRDEENQLRIELLRAQGDTAGVLALTTAGMGEAERAAYLYNAALREQVGAVQALASELPAVLDLYRTPAQRTQARYDSIAADLTAAGIGVSGDALAAATKDQIAQAAVAIFNMAETSDTARLAIVRAAGALATLKDEADASAKAAADTARANGLAALDKAWQAVQRAISAQRGVLQETLADVTDVFRLVGDSARELYGQVAQTAALQAQEGNAFIARALEAARSTGLLPDGDDLRNAIGAARAGLDATLYGSQAEADYDRMVLAARLRGLEEVAGDQLTEAEQQLKALDALLESEQAQMELLRAQLSGQEAETAATLGVIDAVQNLHSVMARLQAGGAGAGGGGGGGGVGGGGTPTGAGAAAVLSGPGGSQYDPRSGMFYAGDTGLPYLAKDLGAAAIDMVQAGQARDVYDVAVANGVTSDMLAAWTGANAQDLRDWAKAQGLQAFADGGWHGGGWALVGEQGPELAYMPPARIYTAQDTARMRASQGGGEAGQGDVLLASIDARLARIEGLHAAGNDNTRRSADLIDKVTAGGNAMATETA